MRFERQFIAIAGTGLALTLAACGGTGGGDGAIPPIGANEPALGKAGAPVEFIEYASTACGHCATFNNNVLHAFKEKHIDTGEVRYALREVITGDPNLAAATFVMARCVAPDKYYPVIDAVFRAQHDIVTSGNVAAAVKGIGLSAGLTEDEYQKCVTNEANYKALEERAQKNSKEGKIESTPTFFINGVKQPYDAGVTLEQLSKAVADAKAKKK